MVTAGAMAIFCHLFVTCYGRASVLPVPKAQAE